MMGSLALLLGIGIWTGFDGPVFWWHFFGVLGLLMLCSTLPLERMTCEERLRRAEYLLCPECVYDLGGLPERGNCPECGLSHTRRDLREVWDTALAIGAHEYGRAPHREGP